MSSYANVSSIYTENRYVVRTVCIRFSYVLSARVWLDTITSSHSEIPIWFDIGEFKKSQNPNETNTIMLATNMNKCNVDSFQQLCYRDFIFEIS